MTGIHEKLILAMLLLVLPGGMLAQTPKPSFILTEPDTLPQRTYEARNYIYMKPGYRFTATSSNDALVARINPSLTFNITSIPNPVPGDTTSSLEDLPYIPGNSFNSDEPKKIVGVGESASGENQVHRVYPVVWLRTVPLTGNLNGAYHLEDICNGKSTFLKKMTTGSWTDYITTRSQIRTYNFNPAIFIANDTYVKKLLTSTTNLAQATIMGIWGLKSDFSNDQFLFTQQGRSNEWILFGKQSVVHSDNTLSDLAYGNINARNFFYQQNALEKSDTAFHEKGMRIGSYYKSNVPMHSVWGEAQEATLFFGAKSDSIKRWNNFNGFEGYMPELLIFNHQLSQHQIQIYNTYLAIKYGITLDTSYLAADGEVIWDYPSNTGYNNRITGYGREDDLGLMQKVSTTSYEEYPYFSDQYDTHDSTDSYHSSSRYRLLVMGFQPANPVNDSRYFIFGDDGGPLKYDTTIISGHKMLTRRWMLQTNTYKDAALGKNLAWISYGQHLIFSRKYGTNIYRGDLIKTTSMDSSAIVSSEALKSKDGYLAWTVDIEYGPIIAKFGTIHSYLEPGQHDYGYRIEIDGQVHSIIKGVVQPYSLFTVEKGQRLEIEKNEKAVYLKVNGVRYKSTEFLIDTADINKTYYGAFILGKNSYNFKLIDFRHGGFVNTGHRIELSYDSKRASGFANPAIGKIYLLVDTTGQGVFTGHEKEYACDELDTTRTKIIFNNIFWDSSPSGIYYFTFAYRDLVTLRSWESDDQGKDPEQSSKDDIQIYSSGSGQPQITVRIQTAELTPVNIQIYDLAGRRIKKRDLPASADITYSDFQLPVAGLYIVKIATKSRLYTRQVVSK